MTLHEKQDEKSVKAAGRLADVATLTPADFDPHVGEVFRVTYQVLETHETHVNPIVAQSSEETADEEIAEITLVEVTRNSLLKEREGGFENRPREPFSLLFEGDRPGLSMQLWVEHPQLGCGRLLFGPVNVMQKNPAQDKFFYEVVFG